MRRKGLGYGKGRGYFNLTLRDPVIHSLSAKGVKTYVPVDVFKKELKKAKLKPYNLPIQTAIIVPSTKKGQKPLTQKSYSVRVEKTRQELFKLFKGFTSIEGFGGFKDKKTGKIIEESTNMVVSYTNKKDFEDKVDDFIKYVKDKKRYWGQESMGVIIENDLLFI